MWISPFNPLIKSIFLKRNLLDPPGRWRTGQPSINPESEAVKRGAKLPVLRIGDIGLFASSRLAPLGLRAICGLLFFAVGFLADTTVFPSPASERPSARRSQEHA